MWVLTHFVCRLATVTQNESGGSGDKRRKDSD